MAFSKSFVFSNCVGASKSAYVLRSRFRFVKVLIGKNSFYGKVIFWLCMVFKMGFKVFRRGFGLQKFVLSTMSLFGFAWFPKLTSSFSIKVLVNWVRAFFVRFSKSGFGIFKIRSLFFGQNHCQKVCRV